MIKLFQKYLLEHFPLLWNIAFVPMLLIALLANLIFLGIGYIITDTAFDGGYSYQYSTGLTLLYFVCVFISLLIFIGWLIFYMRNNAFRNYYPRKAVELYIEWFLCFFICASIAILPVSLTQGSRMKWNVMMSEKNANQSLEVVEMASVLIPSSPNEYTFHDYGGLIPIPAELNLRIDSIDADDYSIEYDTKGQFRIRGYKGSSLLFYNQGNESYYNDDGKYVIQPKKSVQHVISWLKNQNQDSIRNLMEDYILLAQKYNVYVDLNPQQWMDRVYNPPFYPVKQNNLFRNLDNTYSSYYDYDINTPAMQNIRLKRGFQNVLNSYQDNEFIRLITLICLCVALAFSFAVFSCRVTSGKKWLRAFITYGVLLFFIHLVAALVFLLNMNMWSYHSERVFALIVISACLFIFITSGLYLIKKIIKKENKASSDITLNIYLWLIPCVFPLFLYLFTSSYLFTLFSFVLNWSSIVEFVFWINIGIVIIIMIPVCILIRKWKGLSDE